MDERCPQCGAALVNTASARRLTVADAMTRNPVTVGPEDSLMTAVQMLRAKHIRRLPVAVGDQLLGIITQGDIKRAEPSTLSSSKEEFDRVMEGTQVSRIMMSSPITVDPGTTLLEAARTLYREKFGSLPVLDQGRLVGIVTDNDLLRCLIDLLGGSPSTGG
jgi:acetoin utilization protein AcuB